MISIFEPNRPKMSLRRWEKGNPGETTGRCALREYELNRHREAEDKSLENVYRTIGQ